MVAMLCYATVLVYGTWPWYWYTYQAYILSIAIDRLSTIDDTVGTWYSRSTSVDNSLLSSLTLK